MSTYFHRLSIAALVLACSALAGKAHAQLAVSPQSNVQELAAAITGPGVRIANPIIDCHAQGFGEFSYTGSVIGVNDGVLLTTGLIDNSVGPNNVDNRTFEQGTPGNALLNTVTGRTTYDACRLEFDVIPGGDTLRFNFALGSEEYNEWVGSQYNDVFGFFISGPGIEGDPGIGNDKNIALVPNTAQAVTINNVNNGSNQAYYFDNAGGQNIQYDGITQGLQAVAVVEPCQTYRLKLIVADASDRKFDSGVFIERIQSNAVTMETFTATGFDNMVEGCHPGGVRFTRQNITPSTLDVPYFLTGTATNGVDYSTVGDPDPTAAKIAIIPSGQASVEIPLDPLADGDPEGLEYIRVLLGSSVCPGFYLDSVDLFIQDSLFATVSDPTTICPGGTTPLNATGGTTYSWTPASGLSDPNTATPNASPTSTTSYSVVITVGACSQNLETSVTMSSMSLSVNTTRPLCQGQANGAINLNVTGGTAPYQFAWTGPNGFSANTEDLTQVGAGTYTVTVSDGASCTMTQSFNLSAPAPLALSTTPSILPFGQNISCFGIADGSIDLSIAGGTAPYQIAWSGTSGFISTSEDLNGLAAGSYSVLVTDNNGCTSTADRTLVQPPAITPSIDANIPASCASATDGSATISLTGGIPPYSYTWNTTPAQSTAMATGLAQGSHICSISDGYGCTSQITVQIDAPPSLAVSVVDVNDVLQCQGQQNPNGSATAVASGGTAPYSFVWSTTPEQNGASANFSTGGTYSVVTTDANGCVANAQVEIQQPGQSAIAVTAQSNVTCGSTNSGSATVSISGGSSIQSISWNTTPVQTGETATDLTPGTYTATAQHADGCQSVATVSITGPSDALSAIIASEQPVDCYSGSNGEATVVASGGTAPYSYSWNTTPAQTNATAIDLPAGGYAVTVTDALGCTTQTTASVVGPGAALQVDITSFTNVLCFETAHGTANAQASGGTGPYTYSWNSDPIQTGPEAVDLPVGTYSVTVVDANGCTASTSVVIGGPQAGLTSMIETYSDVTCFGGNDGEATLSVSGGSGSYTINWIVEPPQSGLTASNLAPGNYTVSIQDNNGCDIEKFVDFTIAGPDGPLALDFILSDYNGFNVSCNDATDGSIDVTVSGGYSPYSYQWTDLYGGVSGQQNLSGLAADTYILTVTDARGCTVDSTLVLTAPPAIVVEADVTTATCQGSSTGAIDASISGGLAPLNISWSGPNGFSSTSTLLTDLDAGVYVATVTDANGCTVTRSFDVSEPGLFQVSGTMSSYPGGWQISCAGANDGSIDMTVTGGTGNLSYSWTGPGIADPTLEDLSGLGAGTYTLTITDENGCTALAAYTLNAPAPLAASPVAGTYGAFNLSCAGAEDGFINTSITGGTVFYDLAWTGPDGYTANTVSIFGLAPGTYELSVTDANGCTTSASRTLVAPTPLDANHATSTSPSGDAIACFGADTGSIDLSVNGGAVPYTYVWQGPDGFSSTAQDVSGLIAGTYAVTVTDANGCVRVLPVTLTEAPAVVLNTTFSDFNGSAISCAGATNGSIAVEVSGGAGAFGFAWSGTNGFTSNDQDLSDLAAGTYNLTATDANGCTSTSSITLVAADPLDNTFTLSDFNGNAISCAGASDGSITLLVNGGTAPLDIVWSGPDGFASTASDLDGLAEGTYDLTVTDANDCIATSSVTLEAAVPLAIDLDALTYTGGNNVSCSGAADAAVDLSINGGTAPFTIAWTDGLGFTADTEDITNVGAGVYQVIVSDANGCSATEFITLNSPQPLGSSATLSGTPGANIACAGGTDGSIALDINGGTAPYNVAWSSGQSGDVLDAVGAGTYTAIVTDANGCTAISSHTLEAPESVSVTLTPSAHPSGFAMACADGSDGTLDAQVSGGTADYTYAWSGPNGFAASTPSLADLSAGSYSLVVTDANGCTGSTSIALDTPAPVAISINATSFNGGYNVSCMGGSNGQATASVSGGNGTYSFDWNGPNGFSASTATINGATAGNYSLTVTDANGCAANTNITLSEPDALDLELILSDVGDGFNVGCAGNDGGLSVNVSGGTPEYTYSWTTQLGFGSSDQNISDLGPGVYHLIVTDANGCVFETNATLVQPTPVELSFTVVPNTCPGDATASVSVVASGGAAPYDFSWSGPNGFSSVQQDIAALEAGSYSVQVTDALGCTSNFSTSVQGPAGLNSGTYVSFYGQFNLQCMGDSTGVIELAPAGGTAPYTLSVTAPNGSVSAASSSTGLVAGDYLVNIIDANGCVMDTVITLTQPELEIETELTVSIFPSGTNVSCFGSSDGWIEATVNGGAGPYTFTWRGPDSLEFNTPNITGLPAGDYAYELVVADANQCSFFTEVTLTQPDSALVAEVATSEFNGGYEVSCAGAIDGTIDLDVAGGNGGYTVNWSGPDGFSSTGASVASLGAGNYSASISDMNGCMLDVEVVLNAPEPLVLDLDAFTFPGGTQISCMGANDGSITATISGGTSAFTLAWSGPNGFNSSAAQLSDLAPGEYCLDIADANGCVQQACITINEPVELVANANTTTAACGEDVGAVDLDVDGGSAPYSFGWSNGASTEDITGLSLGGYSVTVTDANGCTVPVQADVQGTPAVDATGVVTDNLCNGDALGSIALEVIDGTAPYQYLWSNSSTAADQDGLTAGTYTVLVSDANGCSTDMAFEVTESTAILIDTLLSSHSGGYNVSTHGGEDGSISTVVSGGTAPYSYSWSTGSTASTVSGLPAGTYILEVSDANGCTASIIIPVTQPDDLIMPTGYSPNGDGANDTFFIRGLDAYPANTFVVLNRWGNVVYDRLNYRNDWSGENIQGQQLPNGTYFVILTVDKGARTLQGYVDLRR